MPFDREKYDVHVTYDAILESLNAAIENVAGDLTDPGISGISNSGLKAIRASFDTLVTVRNEFVGYEEAFATKKPVPVPEITPDENGIVKDRYGTVVGRLAAPDQG